jgi:lysophospholipase L1-like esterase
VGVNNNLTSTPDGSVGVLVDGIYQSITPPAVKALHMLSVAVDPSTAHTVEITPGWTQYGTGGNWVYSVTCIGGSAAIIPNPSASRRLVVFGDSIAVGGQASPIPQNGWIQRLRTAYPGRIAMQGWGGATYGDWNGFASAAALAARLVALGFSATTREIWDEMGYNDWAGSWALTSATAQIGAIYDAVHALDASARIWCQTPLITGNESAVDSNGKTIAQFRSAKAAAAAGKSWVTVVDGTTLVAAGALNDGIHPTAAGHATVATNVRAALGY